MLEDAVLALASAAAPIRAALSPAVLQWVDRWKDDVSLYGLAHFHLDLDALLDDPVQRESFLILLREAAHQIPLHEPASHPGGVEGRHVAALLRQLRELVERPT